jgi:hypothetical protein
MVQHRGPVNPEPTICDVFQEVDRVDQKLDRVLNELGEIKQTLKEIASSIAEEPSVDEKE